MTDTAGVQNECDIIMKGGITSGIVYPGAVVELSRKYRFRQIGGASAGAIAATMAAAAESRRRTNRAAGDAFADLGRIPVELGTGIAGLFQPKRHTKAAFAVLMAWIRPGAGMGAKAAATAVIAIRRAWLTFLLAVLIAMVPAFAFVVGVRGTPVGSDGWCAVSRALLVWLPAALGIGLLGALAALAKNTLTTLANNGFGLCNGSSQHSNSGSPALTDWMEATLRLLAGTGDDVVCFRHLWGDDATAAYRAAFTRADGTIDLSTGEAAKLSPDRRRELALLREVDCLVITTDLSHRRPYRFPFDTQDFFWCETCLRDYFADNVVRAMARQRQRAVINGADMKCSRHDAQPLYYFPLAPDIPVVLAARISLSFPGLISAVPFQTVDWTRARENQGVVTAWFSDGGISSNFPMRFFDVVLPTRPTFGINLSPPHPDYPEQMVWRAPAGSSGRLPRYRPMSSMGQFLAAILDTMQNWSDTTQITMPGFRDRIVVIRHHDDEGGMNLQMPIDKITGLAQRGAEAGRNLIGEQSDVPAFDFDLHRWIRYRNAMASLDDMLTGMKAGWDRGQRQFIDAYRARPAGRRRFNPRCER